MTNDVPQRRTDHKGAARRAQILRMLQDNPSADLSVEEIAQRFGVSFATVRRDLARLRERQGVARTYGGIALLQPGEVPTRGRRAKVPPAEGADRGPAPPVGVARGPGGPG